MKKRFFLNGIDMFRDHQSVNQTVENPIPVFPDAAYAPVRRKDFAAMIAEMTPDLTVVQFFVEKRLFQSHLGVLMIRYKKY